MFLSSNIMSCIVCCQSGANERLTCTIRSCGEQLAHTSCRKNRAQCPAQGCPGLVSHSPPFQDCKNSGKFTHANKPQIINCFDMEKCGTIKFPGKSETTLRSNKRKSMSPDETPTQTETQSRRKGPGIYDPLKFATASSSGSKDQLIRTDSSIDVDLLIDLMGILNV